MENKTPKTLEEFAIKEIQDLRKENEELKQELSMCKGLEKAQDENIEFWKNKYNEIYTKYDELISKLKKDFDVKHKKLYEGVYFIDLKNIFSNSNPEQYNFYKDLFNLKEEGEEENGIQ